MSAAMEGASEPGAACETSAPMIMVGAVKMPLGPEVVLPIARQVAPPSLALNFMHTLAMY